MLFHSIVYNILSMASLVELAVAGCERFRGVFIRSLPVSVELSVMLNVAAGEEVSVKGFCCGGSIEKGELLNEELDKETGDRAWSNSWHLNIPLFIL